ncbi:hypothetical protein BDV59DRAFT_211368 [Aspergillus ambiguus]|uniref:uncharacterized protein n=1 Tax=Aspergillus ambiguus TaxID=176160 RepID=UPI003CCD2318
MASGIAYRFHEVFSNLDMTSLGMVRRVNTATRSLVESHPAWTLLREHASDALRIMDATKFARRECRVIAAHEVKWQIGLSWEQLRTIPTIYPVAEGLTGKEMVVDLIQVEALGAKIHGGIGKMKESFLARMEAHRANVNAAGCIGTLPRIQDLAIREDDRYYTGILGMTSFPYWNRQEATLEPGAYCRACTDQHEEMVPLLHCKDLCCADARRSYHRAFLEADLPEHFLHCKAVQADCNFQERRYPEMPTSFYRARGPDFYVWVDDNGRIRKKTVQP